VAARTSLHACDRFCNMAGWLTIGDLAYARPGLRMSSASSRRFTAVPGPATRPFASSACTERWLCKICYLDSRAGQIALAGARRGLCDTRVHHNFYYYF
jgi:hypothetical protein